MLYPYLTIFSQKSNAIISQNCTYSNTILFFFTFTLVTTLQVLRTKPQSSLRDNRIVTYFFRKNKHSSGIILHTILSIILFTSIMNDIHFICFSFPFIRHTRTNLSLTLLSHVFLLTEYQGCRKLLPLFILLYTICCSFFLLLYIILCTIPKVIVKISYLNK